MSVDDKRSKIADNSLAQAQRYLADQQFGRSFPHFLGNSIADFCLEVDILKCKVGLFSHFILRHEATSIDRFVCPSVRAR